MSANDPRTEAYCRQTLPWSGQTQLKLFGAFPLPWGMQASGTFQNLSGIPIQAAYAASNAVIFPSLGRNLSAGATSNVTVNLIEPFTMFEDRLNQVDARLAKMFRVGRYRIQGMLDVYNVLNANTILVINQTYGPAWLRPQQILDGRLFKIGGQFDF